MSTGTNLLSMASMETLLSLKVASISEYNIRSNPYFIRNIEDLVLNPIFSKNVLEFLSILNPIIEKRILKEMNE